MKKWLLVLLLLSPCLAHAQSTNVSGQVTDAGGQSWNNGTVTATFVPNPLYVPQPQYVWTGGFLNFTITGTLTGTGSYSISVPSNTAITPINSLWKFQFCPQATSPCFTTANVTVTGATQTVNATPPTISISPGPGVLAYADGEILNPAVGSTYYNVTSNSSRVCNGPAPCTWGAGGGGGSVSGQANNVIPKGTTATTITQQSSCTDNATTFSCTEPIISASSVSVGTAPVICGTATGCLAATEASTACTPTAGQDCHRADSVTHHDICSWNNGAEVACNPALPASSTNNDCVKFSGTTGTILADAGAACASAPVFPVTVSGTVTSGGIPYFSSTTVESSSALLGTNAFVYGGGAGSAPATDANIVHATAVAGLINGNTSTAINFNTNGINLVAPNANEFDINTNSNNGGLAIFQNSLFGTNDQRVEIVAVGSTSWDILEASDSSGTSMGLALSTQRAKSISIRPNRAETAEFLPLTGGGLQMFGSAPTCTFTSGGGTSPSCTLDTGSNNQGGIIIATTGTGAPALTGTITLTFTAAMGTNKPPCVMEASNGGAGQWGSLVTIRDTTPSTTSDIFTWTNATGATPAGVALSTSTAYWINYQCLAK